MIPKVKYMFDGCMWIDCDVVSKGESRTGKALYVVRYKNPLSGDVEESHTTIDFLKFPSYSELTV